MGNWFGKLDLAYRYTIVFACVLLLTILAGLVKVFFDRRKLKKLAAKQKADEEVKEERMELTRRGNDEGDYFGVRALEAGFCAGVAQSAPSSRANSVVGSPFMSTSTLVGGGGTGNLKDSTNDSVTALPLAHTKERNDSISYDSDTLPSPQSEDPPQTRSPQAPAIRLAPSTAELTGRHRFSTAVDMNLKVPPSPYVFRGSLSPTLGGSDNSDSEEALSPRSPMWPTSPVRHYAPNPPRLSMPQADGFRASFVSVYDRYKSQTGSMLMASPTGTDGAGHPSLAMPGITLNNGDAAPKSPVAPESPVIPQFAAPRSPVIPQFTAPLSPVAPESPVVPQFAAPKSPVAPESPVVPQSPMLLLPRTYQPSHKRDDSSDSDDSASSSFYSEAWHVELEKKKANHVSSIAAIATKSEKRKTLLPASAGDSRYSDIYDAYYRHSMVDGGQSGTESLQSDDGRCV